MIFADQGFAFDNVVRRKIREGPNAAVRAHAGHEIRRDAARVESLRALIRNGLQSIRQVRLLDEGAHLRNVAVRGQEARAASGERSKHLPLVANTPLQARIQRKAVACQTNRRLQAALQGQLAVLARQVLECGGLARNRGGQCPAIDAFSIGLPALSKYMSRDAAPGAFSRASSMVS